MLIIKDESIYIKLEYATKKYHKNAIWFDRRASKSQLSALTLKQELNSCAIVYEDFPLMNFIIIFVDLNGKYYSTVNHENLTGFSYLHDLLFQYLNDYLEVHDNLFVDRCTVTLLKPFKHQNMKKTKSKRRRTNVPRGLRKEVFKRDNYTCRECGAKKGDKKADGSKVVLHVDHIIPVSKGGSDMLDNLQTLCADCNLNKNDLIQ